MHDSSDDESPRQDAGEVVQHFDDLVLSVVAGAQYARRVLEAIPRDDDRRGRFYQAMTKINEEAIDKLEEAYGSTLRRNGLSLTRDNRDLLRDRFEDDRAIGLLVAAELGNPVNPYEIRMKEPERAQALEALASDLECPRGYATAVRDAVKKARDSHSSAVGGVIKIVMLVVGIALILVAPYLVTIVAPAGLAGAAALVAGLAALGPGGMLGGLAIVGAVGAGGGGLAAASALTSGSRESVQQNVIFIQALALVDHGRRPWKKDLPQLELLLRMQTELTRELAFHQRFNDKNAHVTRELKKKLDDISRALECLRDSGIGDEITKR